MNETSMGVNPANIDIPPTYSIDTILVFGRDVDKALTRAVADAP